ncbi:hypothetical protein [Streptomyces kaniharaensis]|uniref:hypothetical protein n=1 Tax=Streptomyces kaniharaensis TaxID=212423 RepID=UPI0012960F69|nr:hypothetical protein [Streptomyces kaniharaensis]
MPLTCGVREVMSGQAPRRVPEDPPPCEACGCAQLWLPGEVSVVNGRGPRLDGRA